MAAVGLPEPKPIVADEVSYTSSQGPSTTDPTQPFNQQQRAYLTKSVIRSAALGLKAQFWFWFRDTGAGLGSDFPYGIYDARSQAKPSYAALKYANDLLRSVTAYVGAPAELPAGLEGYRFAAADGSYVEILWNESGTDQIPYHPVGSEVRSLTGPSGDLRDVSEPTTVLVGPEPRYVFLAAPDSAT
jgi:hypothetical protein